MPPTTVLHVSAVEFSVRTLLVPQLKALAAHGYDVRVACMPEGETFSPELAPYRPIRIPIPRSIRPVDTARAVARLRRIVRDVRPGVVHLHSPSIALPARLAPRRYLSADVRLVHTVHGFSHQWDPPMSPRDVVLDRLERILSRRTDALLFQSREDYEQSRTRLYGGRLVYLGNGVEDRWFDIPPFQRHHPLRLLFVGRLVKDKGPLNLIDAMVEVPRVQLSIVGGQARGERDGVQNELVDRIARYGLEDRVQVNGFVSPQDLPGVMADHDALVLPTFHPEGVPRSILEAAAAGRPVIATDIRGCREVVDDSRNGFLVRRQSAPDLAAAIRRLDGLDDSSFTRMSEAIRQTADRNHRESRVIERLLETYEALGAPASAAHPMAADQD